MKKLLWLPLAVLLCGFACPANPNNLEQNARDTVASLGGLLTTAQDQNLATCTADKTQPTCVLINRGISAQNALISATETYCGMPQSTSLASTTCTPVKSAQAGLQTALDNATQLVNEIKGVVKP
jgi:hypothetical protein